MKGKTDKKTSNPLRDALYKKAVGYDCTETVEEYVSDEGEIKLSKKKVTKKNVPPDMTALKILLEESNVNVESMTDTELEEERQRLLKILAEENKNKELKPDETKKD